ncbi:MAG TPA: aspartyl/asparaginyl beta-hydroxylase domain-containing protein [Enhygromyxa sp.]|nr:aspartyl/asparaginyl beta-hydroxylase domain-containing protein [Enhygromyxa sp.]
MHAFQRPHVPSERAIEKGYRFVELPFDVELAPICAELRRVQLPWQPSQWKWHRGTWFCVLRAGPRGVGPASELVTGVGHDAPILAELPSLKELLDHCFPEPVPLAWLGLSPAGGVIRAHVDNLHHWDEHHRVHVPLSTNPAALLCVDGHCLHLAPGRAWALNNSVVHGARNGGRNRVHLIVDLPPTPAVQAWLASGRHHDGAPDPEALRHIEADPLADLSPRELANPELLKVMAQQ